MSDNKDKSQLHLGGTCNCEGRLDHQYGCIYYMDLEKRAKDAREASGYSDDGDGYTYATNEGSAFYEGYLAGAKAQQSLLLTHEEAQLLVEEIDELRTKLRKAEKQAENWKEQFENASKEYISQFMLRSKLEHSLNWAIKNIAFVTSQETRDVFEDRLRQQLEEIKKEN